MSNLGRVVIEVGKALGKAVVAGLGLELARITTVQLRKRLGIEGDEDDDAKAKKGKKPPADADRDDQLEAVRRENAALRRELDELRAELRRDRAPPRDTPP